VVGIGASAGGLGALEKMLPAIQSDSGLAFVVVQHLNPDFESALPALLGGSSPIPVALIKDEAVVEANRIYVIPPNASLTIVDGTCASVAAERRAGCARRSTASSARWPRRAAKRAPASSCRARAATARSAARASRSRAASPSRRKARNTTA
jgi:chemotaxis response regulator CheB